MSLEEPVGRAARPVLRVGYVPGVTLTKWRRVWAERFPRVDLQVVEVAEAGQRAALDQDLADLCFVRLPVDADGLHLIRLYDEVPVVVAPKDHPVAAFDQVTRADLAGEPLVPDGTDAFDRVAWGAGLLLVPHSVARSRSRRDLVYVPITDAEPTTVGLAWLIEPAGLAAEAAEGSPTREELVEEFVGIVRGRTANSSRGAAARAKQQPADRTARKPGPKPGRRAGGRRTRGPRPR